MASQSDNHIELDFTGENAEEAEDFIRAVNRHAFATGIQRDNAWIAEFAYQSFSRKALRWYETLDEETQTDWKLLKRAILAEFAERSPAPATVLSAAPALVSSQSSPTPAAPPPSTVTGRIRVYSEHRTKSGYLYIDHRSSPGIVSADLSEANIFEVDTSGRTFKFQGSKETLDIRGYLSNWPLSPRTVGYGCMMKSSVDSGTQWNHTWSVSEDGTITAMLLRTDGSQYEGNFLVTSSVVGSYIQVPADSETFLGCYSGASTRVVGREGLRQRYKAENLTPSTFKDPSPRAAFMRRSMAEAGMPSEDFAERRGELISTV